MNFIDICKLTQKELKAVLVDELVNRGYKPINQDGFIYAEGDIPVLLVAHMDTVHKETCKIICESSDGVIMSPQGIGGDDRCGIFMILETIKELRCSVLFAEDEESGCIGANKFCKSGIEPSVEFKYIIEYDRKGANDAVFYDCDNPEFEDFITDKEIGFKLAYGSCSDISYVAPHLKTAAVNLSCGYYNQHTQHEYVVVPEMMLNIERGKQLIRKPCEHFEYIEMDYKSYKSYSGYSSYGGYSAYGGYGNYGSKKSKDYSEFYKGYCGDDIYDNIDEIAFGMYEFAYGEKLKRKPLVPVTAICDYGKKDFIIETDEGTFTPENFGAIDYLYMDKDDCRIYSITTENSWGIEYAIATEGYIKTKDGSSVMYYPSDLADFTIMDIATAVDFDDYVENYLEYDLEFQRQNGLI